MNVSLDLVLVGTPLVYLFIKVMSAVMEFLRRLIGFAHLKYQRVITSLFGRSKTRRSVLLAPAVVVGLLTGCAEKTGDFDHVYQDVSQSLADEMSKIDNVALRVDAPQNFDVALSKAVLQNQGYLAALATEQEAMSLVDVAQSASRLQVAGSSTVGAVRETGGTQPDETTTGAALGINVTQLIYDGGEADASVAVATAQAYVAQQQRIIVSNEIALQAAQAWIDTWRSQSRIGLLDKRTANMDLLISQMERAASTGMVDRAALDSARRQIVGIKLERTRLLAKLSDARLRFERFFGVSPSKLPAPEGVVNQNDALTSATVWQTAPALKRSAANIVVAKQQVSMAKAAFGPRARLQAGITSPMDEGESTDASVGVFVEYKFGDGGRRKADLVAAQSRLEAAEAQLGDAKQMLKAEMAAAASQLRSLDQSMPLVKQQIALSRSEAETARSQLATGQSNLRQLIEAEVDSYRAADSQIAMWAQQLALQFVILGRTGQLAERIGLLDME